MKAFNYLKALLLISFFPYVGYAGNHPEAHFGKYGIEHSYRLSDYQSKYIGQVVKYIHAVTSETGSYDDTEFFIDKGGKYDTEYTISKISGNDEKMEFQLTEVNGKGKVKLTVNNKDEYYSYGKNKFCITDDYTIPLLLVKKLNEDKQKYIGKTFGDSNQYEITDVVLNVNLKDDDSVDHYPRVCFIVTDKSNGKPNDANEKINGYCTYLFSTKEGKTSFVDATNIDDINDLGKKFTNPGYKCNYTVMGIRTKTEYDIITRENNIKKMYFVKNSISGITKVVEANKAATDAFLNDDSGNFQATLSKVEKPSNSSVRYGKTTTVTENNISKYSYVDNIIDILIFASKSEFNFIIKNVSDNSIKVVWNEAVFVDVDGSTSKIMHSGIKYSQREGDQPSSTIIKGAKLEDIAAPTDKVYYSDILKTWDSYSLFNNADITKKNQTVRLMLPIQVKDVVNEYIFEFTLSYVFDHPEYFAK